MNKKIKFQMKLLDIVNLIVAKGANFILTAIIFTLISRGFNEYEFAEFGYLWSIALMIGGMLLGGSTLAMVRVVAVCGSMGHLTFILLKHLIILLIFGVLLLMLAKQSHLIGVSHVLLVVQLTFFGIAVQSQGAVLSLLRATEATRTNLVVTIVMLILIPMYVMARIDRELDLISLFGELSIAFLLSTVLAIFIARDEMAKIFFQAENQEPSINFFYANAVAFTIINVFNYASLNLDFTLFRQIGTEADYALVATAKVFFERFALPALLVFAGAVSVHVLRQPHSLERNTMRLQITFTPVFILIALIVVVVIAVGYKIFALYIRGDSQSISFGWAICSAAGYLFFATNGILFDMLVFRRSILLVALLVTILMLIVFTLQSVCISFFGIPGWSVGWLLFNLLVHKILFSESAEVRFLLRK